MVHPGMSLEKRRGQKNEYFNDQKYILGCFFLNRDGVQVDIRVNS